MTLDTDKVSQWTAGISDASAQTEGVRRLTAPVARSRLPRGTMLTMGIQQMKERASEIVRRVGEDWVPVDVTYHGWVVARLVPVDQPVPDAAEVAAVWADLDRLAAEIGVRWPAGVSAVDSVREGRRDR